MFCAAVLAMVPLHPVTITMASTATDQVSQAPVVGFMSVKRASSEFRCVYPLPVPVIPCSLRAVPAAMSCGRVARLFR